MWEVEHEVKGFCPHGIYAEVLPEVMNHSHFLEMVLYSGPIIVISKPSKLDGGPSKPHATGAPTTFYWKGGIVTKSALPVSFRNPTTH